jgi:hypothetical protein
MDLNKETDTILFVVSGQNIDFLLFVAATYHTISGHRCIVITTESKAHLTLKSWGVDTQIVDCDSVTNEHYESHTIWFNRNFLSENSFLSGVEIDRNKMELQKSIGMDRLRFFAKSYKELTKLIETISFDVVIAEFDVFSSMPFIAMTIADKKNRRCYLYDTNNYKNYRWPEIKDIKQQCQGRVITQENIPFVRKNNQTDSAKDTSTEESSTDGSPKRIGIVFDARYEHHTLKNAHKMFEEDPSIRIEFFPIDPRSKNTLEYLVANPVIHNINTDLDIVDEIIQYGYEQGSFGICR